MLEQGSPEQEEAIEKYLIEKLVLISKLAALKNHQGFIRYLKNTSWMMAEQLLRIIAGLFVGIWVARYLGPEQFGLFSYVLAFTSIFGGIAKLGLDGIMVRELVNRPEKREAYLGTAFWLKTLSAFVVMGLMAAILPFTDNDATTNLYIFIISAGLVFQSFEVIEFYLQSQVLAKMVSICKVVQLSLSSMIKIYLVLTGAELVYFVLLTVFDAVSLAAGYYIAHTLTKNPAFYKHFDFGVAKRLLRSSWPLIFSSIAVMLYMRIDQIMINEMLGAYDVGIYSAAVRLSEAFYFIPTLITASLFPALLSAKRENEMLYKILMQRLYTLMIWVAIAIALGITTFSDVVISILYGNEYESASEILAIHSWSCVFVFLAVSSGKYLTSEDKARKILYRNISGMLLNIYLNFYFIEHYGGHGAAYATVIAWSLAGYFYDFFDRELFEMGMQKTKGFIGIFR